MKTRIWLGLPSLREVHPAQALRLREIERLYAASYEFVWPSSPSRYWGYAACRNMLVKAFLESDCEIAWWIDADVVPPIDSLDCLTAHHDWMGGARILHLPFRLHLTQGLCWSVRHFEDERWLSELPPVNFHLARWVSPGCTFFNRRIFQEVVKGPRWFEAPEDKYGVMEASEEISFCNKCPGRIAYDPRYRASHFRVVDLSSLP